MRHIYFLLGLFFIAGLFAVPAFVFGLSCTQNSDCGSGYICFNNVCSLEQGISTTLIISGEAPPPPLPSPGGTGGIAQPPVPYPTAIVFKGKAYPDAFLTVLKDGFVAATLQADESGYFTAQLTGLSAGIYTFSIRAEDSDGKQSVTLNVRINIIEGVTAVISGILFPPTMNIFPAVVLRGENLEFSGQSFPASEINIFIDGGIPQKTTADASGRWRYDFDSGVLDAGEHSARAKALTSEGEQSVFSDALSFQVLEKFPEPTKPPKPTEPPKPTPIPPKPEICRTHDLNGDGVTDIIDFSILFYWWGAYEDCADQNKDGIVNLADLSIMLYYWQP